MMDGAVINYKCGRGDGDGGGGRGWCICGGGLDGGG